MVRHILFGLFIIAEIMDAMLTYVGIMRMGLEAEANPILVHFMVQYGVVPVLVAKLLCSIVLAMGIYLFDHNIRWLVIINVALWVFAVLPWLLIFFVWV